MTVSPVFDSPRFLILGHRGSPREERENTLDSLRAALASGADGYEIDLRLSADGRIVVYHDDELDHQPVEEITHQRMCDRSMIPIPLLGDIGSELRTASRIVLEVKMRGFEEQILEMIDGWDGVILSSFDHRIIERFQQLGCRAELGLVISAYITGAAAYAANFGVRWYFPHRRFVDVEMVGSMRERGIGIVAWTANRHNDWEKLLGLGAAGVITDVPRDAVAWRRSLQQKPLC
ncbi:MAG: glycerophosphodiester phosphodiesterase [Thermoanaerobaculia bacterium]